MMSKELLEISHKLKWSQRCNNTTFERRLQNNVTRLMFFEEPGKFQQYSVLSSVEPTAMPTRQSDRRSLPPPMRMRAVAAPRLPYDYKPLLGDILYQKLIPFSPSSSTTITTQNDPAWNKLRLLRCSIFHYHVLSFCHSLFVIRLLLSFVLYISLCPVGRESSHFKFEQHFSLHQRRLKSWSDENKLECSRRELRNPSQETLNIRKVDGEKHKQRHQRHRTSTSISFVLLT